MKQCETSLADTSDEIREMFCEACDKDDEYAAANGFCVDCVEYLCSTCLKYHKRLRSDHALQTKTDMPQDFCFKRCELHSKELIKFYCTRCTSCLCRECRHQAHVNCSDIKHIPELVKDYENGNEYKGLTNTIALLTEKGPNIEDEIKTNIKELPKLSMFVKGDIDRYRSEINARLDQLQADMDSKIATIQSQDEQTLKDLLIKHHATMSEIKEMKAELDKHLLSEERSSLFIASQKALKDIVSIQGTLKQIDDNKSITKCVFEPGIELKQTLNEMAKLGIISILGQERKVITTFKMRFDVKAANDTSRSNLTGLKILSDQSTLVVADNNNKKVIVIDLSNKKLIAHIDLDAGPWDVTEVMNSSTKEVAVTIPDLGKMQFLVMDGSGSTHKGKQIKVGTGCRGIASCELGFVISYSNICRLEIIDTKGKILKTISTDIKGDLLFKAPDYVLVNPFRNTMYVSDRIKNIVYCFSESGVVIGSFVGESANGLALDRFGNLIMCSTSGDLRMLPTDLNSARLPVSLSGSIKKVSERKLSWPQCCFFDCTSNCLYVSWKNDPEIRMLHVAYKTRDA